MAITLTATAGCLSPGSPGNGIITIVFSNVPGSQVRTFTLTASNGTQYQQNRPGGTGTEASFLSLPNDTYSLRATDAPSGETASQSGIVVSCTASCALDITSIAAPANTAGTLRVFVGGAIEPLYSQVNGGGYFPVTLVQGANGKSYDITGLAAGTYQVQIKDTSPLNCEDSGQGTVTTGAVSPCVLAFQAMFTTPPASVQAAGGTVGGTLTCTQGSSVRLELQQDGAAVAGVAALVLTDADLVASNYRFEFVGVEPGLYTVYAVTSAGNSAFSPDVTVDGPPLSIGDQLTFLPWVQPQLVNATTEVNLRPTLSLGATLVTDQNPAKTETLPVTTAEVYGPGDVLGINQRAILGTIPNPGATGFSPLQLVAIEFKEEDLPWRFSTLQTDGPDPEPLPWCFLMVLKEDEYETLPLSGEPLPSINIRSTAPFPLASGQPPKLWAHVQVNASFGSGGTVGDPTATPPIPDTPSNPPTPQEITAFLRDTLPANPGFAYSRVLCPRRLEPDTAYRAFLLPAVEAGRLAGLGKSFVATDVRNSALPSNGQDRVFPVYFQWAFTTGVQNDFEELVKELHPVNDVTTGALAPTLAVRFANRRYDLPMPNLLVDKAAPAPKPLPAAVSNYVFTKLGSGAALVRSATGRPLVTPPLYGRAYLSTPALPTPTAPADAGWKQTLNLDPRYRTLAALGAQVVQDNQEEYVRRAWEQVQEILLANERVRGIQYGLRTTAGLRDQHLPLNATTGNPAPTPPSSSRRLATGFAALDASDSGAQEATSTGSPVLADYGLHLTGLALGRIRMNAAPGSGTGPEAPKLTVRETIRRSSTPLAAFSPTFRRIVKPFGKYQVNEAGRPLRPTQPEPELDAQAGLRQPGTSLRQRDELLTRLAEQSLVAAPERAERMRAYQFDDGVVDALLEEGTPLSLYQNGALVADAGVQSRFQAAYSVLRMIDENTVLGFRYPQRVRPALSLAEVKQQVVLGTLPGPVFGAQIKQASPVLPAPGFVGGDFAAPDFNATDFYVGNFNEAAAPATFSSRLAGDADASESVADSEFTPHTQAFTTAAISPPPALTDAALPIFKQAKVFPVFKEAMGEALRQRHPELFVPALGDFPAGGVAVLDVNRAFIEAYMVGLNHALGSELSWRGFPVDVRGTYFQQFWDVSEHLNAALAPGQLPSAAAEAALLDIRPIDEWVGTPLGSNAAASPAAASNEPLRLVLRSELLRRYPTLVLALQPGTADGPDQDPSLIVLPRQRLSVGQDLALVTFDVPLAEASAPPAQGGYYLLLMERPGQPEFGLDLLAPVDTDPTEDPLSWNDLSWEYLGTVPGQNLDIDRQGKPRASAEPAYLEHLADSAAVAYALFQEPVLAALPLHGLLG
ncbi:MAG TPA: hypothetical protein VF629_15875 [Hymenobacter sp.]|jgi:hypothetical protein|uniref:hypothetical protein n=1 Tax=Hymenobacter sp. TaxID=1898978 RepID=UPI002EDAF2AD